MKRIIILTGSELRHQFFRKYISLSSEINVVRTYCEGLEKSLDAIVDKEDSNSLRKRHLRLREQSEKDFFQLFVDHTPDRSNPVFIPKGDINKPENVEAILNANPDLLIAYGCSIIKDDLLDAFKGKFLNVHLGLSPYYRGSGTNFWPFVNEEPEYVGATFMYIDKGVDTGEVIHQIRPRIFIGDNMSSIGNRLIADMAKVYKDIIINFDELEKMPQIPVPENERYYRKKDFSEESVERIYENFDKGLINRYLEEERERTSKVPLIENVALKSRTI